MEEKELEVIKSMKFHDSFSTRCGGLKTEIIRVVGGWLYAFDMPGYNTASIVFVPEQITVNNTY